MQRPRFKVTGLANYGKRVLLDQTTDAAPSRYLRIGLLFTKKTRIYLQSG